MPGWAKVLLGITIPIVVIGIIAIIAVVVWWTRNKDAFMGRAKEVLTEGRDFGRHSDYQGCVDEAISRYKQEPGFTSGISASVFERTCLEASKPTSGFCDTVPKSTEFIKGAQWRLEQCRKVDLEKDSYCQQLFQPVQQFCELPRDRPSRSPD